MSVLKRHSAGMHRRRRWLTAGLAVVSSTAAVIALAVVPAFAVHDTGAFELDGNATNNPAVPGDDWDNVCHQVTGSDCSTTSDTNGATAVDWVSEPNVNTTIFTTGGFGVISDKPFVDISSLTYSGGGTSLGQGESIDVTFAADQDGTWEIRAGGGVDASGELLTDNTGATSGYCTVTVRAKQ